MEKHDLTSLYREVFSSHNAQLVLADLIYQSRLFDSNGGSIELKCFAAYILEILGGGSVDMGGISQLLNGLKNQKNLNKIEGE